MSDASSEDLHALVKPEQLARMRREWRLQHIGWALIAVLVLAGAAGLFGSGPLSWSTRSAGGTAISYERFIRRDAPFTLNISVPVPTGSTQAEFSLSGSYFENVRIESISPIPLQTVSASDVTRFVYSVEDPATPLTVTVHGEATEVGVLNGELAAGDARIPFQQLVWP